MSTIEWLLDSDDVSIRYRTLVELIGANKNDEEVQKLKKEIEESPSVRSIIGKMHPDGYWLQKNQQSGILLGQGVEYGSFATTHFCLSYLAEMGMDRSNSYVELAANRYLNLQKDDGDWWEHLSCLYAYNIRTFILLGYREDTRLQRVINLMINTARKDGGYLCDLHEKKSLKSRKSCIRGSAKALLAFSEMPEYWENERCLQLVDYFLSRYGIYKHNNHDKFVNKDVTNQSFPIIWRTNTWEILYALGKMGYGGDPRLERAWEVIASTKDSLGKVHLDWTPTQCPWKIGKREDPNEWITFYTMLAEKYRK